MAFINNNDRAYLKKIQLLTKKKLHAGLNGPQISARRGYGLEFDQLRSYESGDDIRFVDWKASARNPEGLMIKQYLHDYTKNIVIALDCSASMSYGSTNISLFACAQRLAIIIACVAEYTKARCSIIIFDNDIVRYVPPCVPNKVEIISQLQTSTQSSNFVSVFKNMMRYPIKNSLVLVLSDFIGCDAMQSSRALSKYAEIIALRLNDSLLSSFKHDFYVNIYDNEHGTTYSLCSTVNRLLAERLQRQNTLFRRHAVNYKDFFCNASSYKELTDMLVTFFNQNVQLYC